MTRSPEDVHGQDSPVPGRAAGAAVHAGGTGQPPPQGALPPGALGEEAPGPAGGAPERTSAPSAGRNPLAEAMTEDRGRHSLDAHVRRLIRDLGLRGYHTRDSRGSARGYPDWTVCGPLGVLFRELKSQRGRVTPEQREWLDALTAAGQDADVWRPADLLSGRIAHELAAISSLGAAA